MDNVGETKLERRRRLQRANDRNAIIAFTLGMLLVLGWVLIGAMTGESTLGIVALLGVLLIVLGLIFKGRPVR
ncbi:MAG TPA: hypothetical protein VK053_16590 [Jiangellaceae bacterium]|nr:hypothetical protein [Jiangellaceae bacterium]